MPPQMLLLGHHQQLELETLYRKGENGRVRVRALCILLAAEQGQSVSGIAETVRYHEETVRRWINRYLADGINGLYDAPKSGAPRKANNNYLEELFAALSQSPSELGLPFSRWTNRRLADHLAERTGLRLSSASLYRLKRQKAPSKQN